MEKKLAAEVENKEKLSLSMDIKEKDNKELFSIPKRRSTLGKPQVEPLSQVLSVSILFVPKNLSTLPIFVILIKS